MKVTFFSVVMSILWGSLLMLMYSGLRKNRYFIDVCSLTGVVTLYVFCALRMLLPIEWSTVMVIPVKRIYNPLYKAVRYTVNGGPKVWQILLGIWIFGAVAALIRLGFRYHSFAKQISPIKAGSKQIFFDDLGINKDCRIGIYRTNEADVPVTVGIIHKDVLIPDKEYSKKELGLIIRHELSHIKNGDLFIQLLINILCAIYWWNPAVYIFRKDLEHYFELRCDKSVTLGMSKNETADYLEVLLKIYKESDSRLEITSIGVIEDYKIGGDELKERFERLYQGFGKRNNAVIGKLITAVITISLFILSYSFIFQSAYPPPEMEEGTFEVNKENSYLIRQEDGKYLMKTDNGFQKIVSNEAANMFIKEGFTVVEEK